MPKKRKTQLKPVARGFATTSIPKKATQADEIVPPTDGVPLSDGLVTEAAEATADHQAALPGVLQDPEKLAAEQDEQQFLQVMVDRYQEKTEKEITRTIKACSPSTLAFCLLGANPAYQAIEVDKRISREFNTVEVDPVLVEEILRLHVQEETSRGRSFSFAFTRRFDSISMILSAPSDRPHKGESRDSSRSDIWYSTQAWLFR